ncbi:MAG: hypothetical protein AAF791_10565 [Bacteroidota bacterium]
MRFRLVLLTLLPLAACERPSDVEEPGPTAARLSETPDAERSAERTHRAEAPRREAAARASPPPVPSGASAHRADETMHPAERETVRVPDVYVGASDAKHAAWLQSQRSATPDTTSTASRPQTRAPQPHPATEAVAGADTTPLPHLGDAVVLPGSIVM